MDDPFEQNHTDYDNYVPKYLSNKYNVVMFADDTTITVHEKNFKELKSSLSLALEKTKSWFDMNKLALNENKTRCMQYFSNNNAVNTGYITLSKTSVEIYGS